jgi:hypothetical protein
MVDALDAVHDLSVDTIKAALYLTTANLGAGTNQYTSTGEVIGLNYVPGGVVVPSATPPLASGKTTYWTPSANIVYPGVTLAAQFNAVMLYNASKLNKTLGIWTFTAKVVNSSTFTLRMPANSPAAALLRWKSQ